MTTTYTYASTDFTYDVLFNDIKASSIYKSLTEMYRNGDNIYVTFKTLSTEDDDILSAIIANHNTTSDKYIYFTSSDSVNVIMPYIWNKLYTTFGQFTYKGTDYSGVIKAISCISCMRKDQVAEYTVRVFDVTNSTVISEDTFDSTTHSCTTEEKIELTINEDLLPANEAIIELQAKSVVLASVAEKIRWGIVYFKSIDVFYYNNHINNNSNNFNQLFLL